MCLNCNNDTRKLSKRKPKDWINKGYRIEVPYKFKWRHKIGKVKCTCKDVIEDYACWYGITWYHQKECAIMQLIEKKPQINNLIQYCEQDLSIIAQTD